MSGIFVRLDEIMVNRTFIFFWHGKKVLIFVRIESHSSFFAMNKISRIAGIARWSFDDLKLVFIQGDGVVRYIVIAAVVFYAFLTVTAQEHNIFSYIKRDANRINFFKRSWWKNQQKKKKRFENLFCAFSAFPLLLLFQRSMNFRFFDISCHTRVVRFYFFNFQPTAVSETHRGRGGRQRFSTSSDRISPLLSSEVATVWFLRTALFACSGRNQFNHNNNKK